MAVLWRNGLWLLSLALVPTLPVYGAVNEYQLDNGMTVLVKPDRRAPVVVTQVWYKVGSSYEHGGITGVSHVLEHMMFKGTEKHPPGEFSRIISANGGEENAFTGRDYTAYHQQLERSRLEVSLELEADRMRNLILPEEEFVKEVEVVMEERRLRTEDKPRSLTYEQFYATAFTSSPYQHPVIGWMDDLKSMDVADLSAWYKRWYSPNNAILVVVGDVDAAAVYALAKKHFGSIQPSAVEPPKPRVEPPQRGARRVVVKAPGELPYLLMGFKVPSLNTAEADWEPYALEVLASVLDGGSSARFAKHLVREQRVAAEAGAGYDLYSRLGDLFLIDATPANGHSVADVEQAIRAEIERVKTEPVSSAELERIKAQVVANQVYERDSVFYQGMQLGLLETVGLGWERMDEYVAKVRAVTAEQIMAVAQKYLIDDHSTVAELKPLPVTAGSAAAPARVAASGSAMRGEK